MLLMTDITHIKGPWAPNCLVVWSQSQKNPSNNLTCVISDMSFQVHLTSGDLRVHVTVLRPL